MSRKASYTPFLFGLGMVGLGLLARQAKPSALRLPEPADKPSLRDIRGGRDAARAARDGIADITPNNLTSSLGRTLIFMGGVLLAVRALDELVDDDSAEY